LTQGQITRENTR